MTNIDYMPITFMNGCAISRNVYYAAAFPDSYLEEDEPYSVMLIYQNHVETKWLAHHLPNWKVKSTCFPELISGGTPKIYALNADGEVECYGKMGGSIEVVAETNIQEDNLRHGLFNRIRKLGNHLYVCGYGCQVYKRAETGWKHWDAGILQEDVPFKSALGNTEKEQNKMTRRMTNANEDELREILKRMYDAMEDDLTSLYDINGLSEDDLYVVGNRGFMAHYDGRDWTPLLRLTAAHLNCIHVVSPLEVWIVGSRGTVLRGNARDGFAVIARKTSEWDFLSVTSYQGIIYISADDGIYTMRDKSLERLEISDQFDLRDVSDIEEKDGVLWALSPKKLIRFDGNQWEYFTHPNNPPDETE